MPLVVVGYIAAAALLAFVFKPSIFPGASHRAAESVEATSDLLTAEKARGAAAAASVVKIAEANTAAPDSPAREFIAMEAPVALSHLPQADASALIESERRRAAVFAGERDEARRLYGLAALKAEKLSADLAEATEARKSVDAALVEAAASEHRLTLIVFGLLTVSALLGGGFLYLRNRFGGISQAFGAGFAELRQKHPEIASVATDVFDRSLDRHEQKAVRDHT